MDSTINKFWVQMQDYYNTLYQKNIELCRENLTNYQIIESFDSERGHLIRDEIFSTPGFWETVPIYDNCFEGVKYLYDKYDVRILSAPWSPYDMCCTEKIRWTKKNLPFIDINKIIFSNDKSIIAGDLLIDDAPYHLAHFANKTIAVDFPYNKKIPVNFRSEDWSSIIKAVDVIFQGGYCDKK
jgi:5'-nucleotidase